MAKLSVCMCLCIICKCYATWLNLFVFGSMLVERSISSICSGSNTYILCLIYRLLLIVVLVTTILPYTHHAQKVFSSYVYTLSFVRTHMKILCLTIKIKIKLQKLTFWVKIDEFFITTRTKWIVFLNRLLTLFPVSKYLNN